MVDKLTIRITKELRKELDVLAKAAKRKTSDYVRVVLEEHVERAGEATATTVLPRRPLPKDREIAKRQTGSGA